MVVCAGSRRNERGWARRQIAPSASPPWPHHHPTLLHRGGGRWI